MIITCYYCGYKSRRKKKPKSFKCPVCRSGSYRWDTISVMTDYEIQRNNKKVREKYNKKRKEERK